MGQGILWLWFVNSQKEHHSATARDKVKTLASLLANYSTAAILSHNYGYLDQYMEVLSSDGDIISVKILDKNGNILREKIMKSEQRGKSINPFYIPWSNPYSMPIKSDGESIGKVEIVYSGEKTNKEITKLLTVAPIGQILVFSFIILGIYYFFQKTIGSPIEALKNEIEKATAGDLTVKIPKSGNNEIGDIASGVGFLIDRLKATLNRLKSTADNVSMAINQLNLTFNNVITGTQKQTESVQEATTYIKQAKDSQDRITSDTGKLIDFSNENVTSLLEMKATAEEIVSSTTNLFKATEDAYSVVAEMSQTAKIVSANTDETSSAIEETSASVAEINASVREVETSAKESASLASKVTEVASEVGMMAVMDAIEGMEKIAAEVKHSSEIIGRLGTRSSDIEKILSVIKDVTEQTNLLSLNAAILAAQAGEYGKSFSVVADEIRALSDRTASSTRDISNIVKTIQTEIAEAIKAIDSGMNRVDEGSTMVYNVGSALRETLHASEQSADMSKSIERATEEQSKGLKQISLSIENIRKMIGQIAKATHEQQKGTSHLLDTISDVKNAADIVNQGTEEEATSIKMISKNLELADEHIKQIGKSTSNHQKVNENIINVMEQIKIIGITTVRDVEDVSISLSTLHDEIELLKKEMEAFKIGE
jgi:methyl-accepting chemotaxis protein